MERHLEELIRPRARTARALGSVVAHWLLGIALALLGLVLLTTPRTDGEALRTAPVQLTAAPAVTTPAQHVYDGNERQAAAEPVSPTSDANGGAATVRQSTSERMSGFAAEDQVSLSLKYKLGWNAAQRAAADSKVGALNDAAGSGGLRVTQVERSGTSAASRYSRAGGDIPSGLMSTTRSTFSSAAWTSSAT